MSLDLTLIHLVIANVRLRRGTNGVKYLFSVKMWYFRRPNLKLT